MKTWIITDTHLNHQKMETYCQRPSNHTELIDQNIHKLVAPTDILIHNGDIGMGKPEFWMDTVRKWPGIKWLILGNHDGWSAQRYVEEGLFHMACDALLYRGIWLTHKPSNILPEGARLNVHGHLHNVWDGFGKDDPERTKDEFNTTFIQQKLPQPFQRLLAVEYTNYAPVDFDKFVAKGHKLWQSMGPNAETKKRNATGLWKYAESLAHVPDATGDSNEPANSTGH
jgi:calcineurin-like phosphoesterase family protein